MSYVCELDFKEDLVNNNLLKEIILDNCAFFLSQFSKLGYLLETVMEKSKSDRYVMILNAIFANSDLITLEQFIDALKITDASSRQ